MKIVKKIYDNEIYTLFVIFIALISLFVHLPDVIDLGIDGLFVLDVVLGTLVFIFYAQDKSLSTYFKYHILDIIACVPIQFFGIFKTFRLLRLIRISRLFKLRRTIKSQRKFRASILFRFETFKELAIYFLIYLIGNVYVFKEIEHLSDLDAAYWVVSTITTVGYGDVTPHHTLTKLLAILLMIIGVAMMGYINGVIITAVISQVNNKED